MVGSSRTNDKGKEPAYANCISPNTHSHRDITFHKGNVYEDDFDSILDTSRSISNWDNIHRSAAQGIPEPIRNPKVYSMNHNSLQNPQTNLSSNCGGESSFGYSNRSHVKKEFTGSSSLFCPRNTAPVHNRNNVGFNTNQSGIQEKFEGGFLSLGLGDTSKTVSNSQHGSRQISDKLKDSASDGLKIARDRKSTGKTYDDGFMGSHGNNTGSSNQSNRVSRMASTNKGFGSGTGSSSHHISHMQQNDRRLARANKRKEVASTELKMVRARKASLQTLDADFMDFQRNNSSFSNQFSNVDLMTSTNFETVVHSTFNSGSGSSRQSKLKMCKNNGGNKRSGDMDHYKGNHSVNSATTLVGNSAHSFKSEKHNFRTPTPSRMTTNYTPSKKLRHFCSTTANIPNYAGQVTSQNDTPTHVIRGDLSSQRTTTPQVSWVDRGLAGIKALFPKRLGFESSVRNSPQGSTHMPHNVSSPIGRSDDSQVSYPVNHQEPFLTYGQSRDALFQLPEGHQGAHFTNTSSVNSQSQKLNFHAKPHHKRTTVEPQSTSHWVQHKKRIHPAVYHSIPVGSHTQPAGPVAANIRRVIPRESNVRHHVHVASAPIVSHITWKDPDATYKLNGYKCFLCKKDVGLTSENPVLQPAMPPPVAVLSCGHTFHDECLRNITPDDLAKDPPCIPCAIGEN